MPAPITYKATYFFNAQRGYGWTETFYGQAPDLPTALTYNTQSSWINTRLALLTSTNYLTNVRVTNASPGASRQSLVKAYTLTQGSGTWSAALTVVAQQNAQIFDAAPVFEALAIRLEAGAQNRRIYLMRGIPDSIGNAAGDYTPTAAWISAFNSFATQLMGSTSGFYIRTQTSGASINPYSWTISNNGLAVTFNVTAANDPNWVRGQIVRVRGIQGAAFLNGLWKINGPATPVPASTPAQNMYILTPKKRPVYGVPNTVGFLSPISISTAAINNVIPERVVKKATGRPSGPSRGRARVRTG